MRTLRYTGKHTGADPMTTRFGHMHPGDTVEVDDETAEVWLTEHIQGHETKEDGTVEVIYQTDFEEVGVDAKSNGEPAEGKKRSKATNAEDTTPASAGGEEQSA
jgi:hypothetical protein